MNKIAVLTGASGHLGFLTAKHLLEKKYQVRLLLRSENKNTEILKNLGAELYFVNLFQPLTYQYLLANTAVFFHIAAENNTSALPEDAERIIQNTYLLTKTVIDTALAASVPTVIYTSSVVVLGRSAVKATLDENAVNLTPENPYVQGKLLAENYCSQLISEKQADIRRLYPSWVIGKGDARCTPPHKIVREAVNKAPLFYFGGGVSIADAEEVAKAHVSALEKGKKAEKYIVAGENITFKALYELIAYHHRSRPPSYFLPKFIIYIAAVLLKYILSAIGKSTPFPPKYINGIVGKYSWYSSQKAVENLGYQVKPATQIIKNAVIEAKKKIYQTEELVGKNTPLPHQTDLPEGVLLITGAPGWLGNRMIDVLLNGDSLGRYASLRKVRLLVYGVEKEIFDLPPNFEVVEGSLTDKERLKQVLEGVTTVFHLAGAIYPPHIKTLYKVNYEGTVNLADACIEKGVKRIVFMSTDAVCGHGTPTNRIFDENTPASPYKHYGKSKYLAEKYLLDKTKEGALEATVLRGFWFFGKFAPARQQNFIKMFGWKRQIVFGNGKNFRNISHTDHLVSAFFEVENRENTIGQCYWIGEKRADITVDEIYRTIAKSLNTTYKPLYIPIWCCRLIGLVDSFLALFGRLHPTLHAAGKFHYDISGSTAKAEKDFGYDTVIPMSEYVKSEKWKVKNGK
jgi:dihydroflavonol-4-reductase